MLSSVTVSMVSFVLSSPASLFVLLPKILDRCCVRDSDTKENGLVTIDVEMKADTEVMAPAPPRTIVAAATKARARGLRLFIALMGEFMTVDCSR